MISAIDEWLKVVKVTKSGRAAWEGACQRRQSAVPLLTQSGIGTRRAMSSKPLRVSSWWTSVPNKVAICPILVCSVRFLYWPQIATMCSAQTHGQGSCGDRWGEGIYRCENIFPTGRKRTRDGSPMTVRGEFTICSHCFEPGLRLCKARCFIYAGVFTWWSVYICVCVFVLSDFATHDVVS